MKKTIDPYTLKLCLRFLKYVTPYKRHVFTCAFIILFTTLTSLSLPIFSMIVIDRILLPKAPQLLHIVGIAVLAIVIVNGLAGFIQTLVFVAFKYRVLHRIRLQLYRKIQSLDLSFFIKHQKGYIVSRIHHDAGLLATLMSNLLF